MTLLPEGKKESIFENIYDNHSPSLYGIILRISPNTKQAEEILIQTFRTFILQNVTPGNSTTVFTQLLRISICVASEKINLPKDTIVKIISKEFSKIKQCS